MKFQAELKQVKLVKKASLDSEYQILLITDNSDVLDLGKLEYDTLFNVEINVKEA